MKIKPLEEIKSFCENLIEDSGITIKKVEFKNGDYPTLTVFIDKKGGVDLDTCETVSNLINEPLDEFDPTYGLSYNLNVSSLGIDRAFETDEDFNSHIGKMVEVKLKTSIKGKKSFDGILCLYDGKTISIKIDGKNTFTFDIKNVIKVNEYIDF